jgi:hypothetical protein
MGTYRNVEHTCACLCGLGTFQIDYCEVDHPWPTSTPEWYSPKINCNDCIEKYEIQERSKSFYVIEKVKIQQLELLGQQASTLEKELLASDEVAAIKEKLINYLNAQKSIAAIHRILSEAELVYSAIGTFRKRWSGPNEWLRSNLNAQSLITICRILSLPSDHIALRVEEIDQLREQAYAKPEPHGEAIYRYHT